MTGRVRVLVTDAGSTKALAVVRALGPEYEVWTTSRWRGALASWSRYATRHLEIDTNPASGFAPRLLAECVRHAVKVVITPEERSSLLVARAQQDFESAGVRLTTAPLSAIEIAMDKARTAGAARAAGVALPRTVIPESATAAVAEAAGLGYPVVVKPRFSHFWTGSDFISTDGVAYANNAADLARVMAATDPALPLPLLQEFVAGRGLGIFLLIGGDGSLLAEFAHERIRDLRPTGSGSVVRRSVPVNPELREAALRLLRHVGWRGAAMVEFRGDASGGTPMLMEINGRLWGSLQLATDAGVNFPKLLVQDALGEPVAPVREYRSGVVLRWWLGDFARLVRVFRGRPRGFTGPFPGRLASLREFLGPQAPGTRAEILRWDDPLPAVGEIVGAVTGRR